MSELALTDRESRRLKSLEGTISRSAGDMYDALRAIHDEKLYRDSFPRWEDYCGKRWGMSKRHADRLMEHGRILGLLADDEDTKTGPIGPISEAATREVSKLPDVKKVEVLTAVASESKAKNNGKPKVTAAAVRAKVQHQREPGDESESTGAEPVKRNVKPIKATADLAEAYVDDAGAEVPESLFPVWQQRDAYMRICDDMKTIAGEISELAKSPAGRGCAFIAKQVNESGKMLALAMPSVISGRSWKSVGEAGK